MKDQSETSSLYIHNDIVQWWIRRLPADLKYQFKALCIMRHETMAERIIELMYVTVRNDKDLAAKRINLKTKFRMWCERRDTTMKDQIVELMREAIKDGLP